MVVVERVDAGEGKQVTCWLVRERESQFSSIGGFGGFGLIDGGKMVRWVVLMGNWY